MSVYCRHNCKAAKLIRLKMLRFIIFVGHKNFKIKSVDHCHLQCEGIKKNEMGGTCGMCGGKTVSCRILVGRNMRRGEKNWEDLDVYGMESSGNRMGRRRMDWSGSV
jgi:hypothetical protein